MSGKFEDVKVIESRVIYDKHSRRISVLVELKKAVLLALVSVFLATAIFGRFVVRVEAGGTIYIRPDGTVEGTDRIQRDGNVYTFTENIYDSIVVEKNNIMIDGGGYTLEGTGSGHAISLSGRTNVTIMSIRIRGFGNGVDLLESTNNSISGNTITDNHNGIYLEWHSNYSNIAGNNITDNYNGIYVDYSYNNSISGNTVTHNDDGICLDDSTGNRLYGNIVIANDDNGIRLRRSSSNNMTGNKIVENREGVVLSGGVGLFLDNVISGNYIGNNSGQGVGLWSSASNNTVSGNTIIDNESGIYLEGGCSNNSFSGNNVTNNNRGIRFWTSSNNTFSHNNLMNNTQQVYFHYTGFANVWNDSYPAGGNYWSDYDGVDEFSGPDQNVSGSDGIGDTPYVVDEHNQDRYPFVVPLPTPPSPPVAHFTLEPTGLVVGQEITFDASNSFDLEQKIGSYRWNFGDGNISSTGDSIIAHAYKYQGRYTISLTVFDNGGLNSSISQMKLVKMPTFISISTGSPSTFVGFKVNVTGTLRDIYGKGLRDETVVLSYTFVGISTWTPITSYITDDHGNYHVVWIPPATGYFVIKTEWTENSTHSGTHNTTTLSSLVYDNEYVFSVESNSTISELAFNTTDWTLRFTATGSNGTRGYVKVTVTKSLVEDITNIRVYLDSHQPEYSITSTDDSWHLTFDYMHSTHQVVVDLGLETQKPWDTYMTIAIIAIIAVVGTILLVYFTKIKKTTKKTKQ